MEHLGSLGAPLKSPQDNQLEKPYIAAGFM